MTTLTEVVRHPVVRERYAILLEGGRSRGVAADSQPGHDRRQRVAGHALLVLPRRLAVLPRRRQHLLRRHADGDQSRARDPRRRPLRGRQPVRHRARADRARRADGDPQPRTASASCAAEDYFIGPGTDITRMTVLPPGELLTAIRMPGTWAGAQFYFEKVRDRNVWDFPLVNVASAMRDDRATTIERMRHRRQRRGGAAAAAGGGRGRRPRAGRATRRPPMAAGEPGHRGRRSRCSHNAYKVPLLRNLVQARDPRDGGQHMDVLTWGRSPWGEWILTHISWDLLWASLFAGVAFLVAHASYMVLSAHRKRARRRDRSRWRPRAPTCRRASRAIRWPRGCSTG